MEDEKFSVDMFKLIFLLMGLRIDSKNGKFEKYYAYVCVVVYPFLLGPQLAPIFTLGPYYHKMIAFVFFFSTVNIVAMTVWIHRQRYNLVAVYTTIISERDVFDEECFDSTVKHKMKIILSSLFCIVSVVYSTPLIIKFSTYAYLDPVFMLFIPAVYPWSVDSPMSYSLTILFQVVTDFIPSLTALGYVLCLQYFHALLASIKLTIEKKIHTLNELKIDPDKWDRECVRSLCNVIQSYNLLQKMMKTFAVIIRLYVSMATWTFFAAGTVLTGFQLLQTEWSYLAFLRMLSFQTLFGANLIFCTQVSQWCYEVNYEIMMALYQTKWYKRSIRFRKTMAIFMCVLQRSYHIRVFGISALNWTYITKITKFTYSVLQVFLKIK